MNLAALVDTITQTLAPALPYLVLLGGKAAEKAASKLGEDAWQKAKGLWQRLRPKVESQPVAKGAVEALAKEPESEGAKGALRWQLEEILEADPELARELARLVGGTSYQAEVVGDGAVAQGPGAVAGGKGSVVAGRDITGDVKISRSEKSEDG